MARDFASLDRRRFLELGLGVSAMLAAPAALAKPTLSGPFWNRVLVLVELKGGNDGLNTVIPYADPAYAKLRPTIAVERAQIVQLNERIGLHPGLAPLVASWKERDLGVVLGLGYPDPNRSHFRSIEIWDTASASNQTLGEGWIARAFARNRRPPEINIDAVVVDDNTLPVAGNNMRNVVMRDAEQFVEQARRMKDGGMDRAANPALRHILAVQHEVHQAALSLSERMKAAPAPSVALPSDPFGRQLDLAARLLLSKLPVTTIKVALGGFDTHARQRPVHDRLMGQLGQGLAAFRDGLKQAGLWDKVLVMTYSEFGRRAGENGSQGTDHGTAAPHLVMGGLVKGGLHGRYPSLTDLSENDLKHTVDFRVMFSTVLQRWWGIDHDLMPGRNEVLDFLAA